MHFRRAAERLLIAQPALSKAIRRIESRLAVQLFLRSNRGVALTPAGDALLHHGRLALAAVSSAARSAQDASGSGSIRLVIKPGGDANLLSRIIAEYSRQPDARRVEVLFGGNTDRADYLRDGRADVALLYVPFDDLAGLSHTVLYAEPRVAILPAGHRLASRTEVFTADLDGETLPRWKGLPDDGAGPRVADVPQMNDLIALGQTVGILPRSLAEPAHPALVYVSIVDAPESQLVVAWLGTSCSPLVFAFVEAATKASRSLSGARQTTGC